MSSRTVSTTKSPKVRIAQPTGRPFQIRYTCPIEKREIRISVGSRNLNEATRMKVEIEAKLVLGLEVKTEKAIVLGPGMDWTIFREKYSQLHLMTVRGKTADDAESRLDIAQRIMKPKTLGEMCESNNLQILQAKLLAGEQSLRKKPRSPFTVRGYMKSIVAALNWAYAQDWLVQPPKLPRMKVARKKVMKGRPITEDEFKAMLSATETVVGNAAADSWRHVLHGLWESALRIDELMHVSWDEEETIVPAWPEGEYPILKIPASLQKNDTEEDIPLLPGFEALLTQTPPGKRHGWIFNPQSLQTRLGRRQRHGRPDADWVGKVVTKIGKEAGIIVATEDPKTGRRKKFASAHDLRRSCAERLRNAGIPPLVICRVMRHSSWETTRKHYAPGDVQSDAKRLHDAFSTKLA